MLQGLLFTALATGLAFALAGERGTMALARMDAARVQLEESIARLEAENRELELELRQLRRPGHAAERVARETLGLVAPGEIVYVDPPR